MKSADKTALLARLRCDAERIATHFGLVCRDLDAERGNVKRRYGSCHADGRIRIRLTHARTGQPLRYSSLIDTLCHELAHLRHFNHGPAFREYFWRLLAFARREGIYQPRQRPTGAEAPRAPSPARSTTTAAVAPPPTARPALLRAALPVANRPPAPESRPASARPPGGWSQALLPWTQPLAPWPITAAALDPPPRGTRPSRPPRPHPAAAAAGRAAPARQLVLSALALPAAPI
ncbi:MAG: DUF45 domain-containing protein [Proteobacteria bacterium]|nr:DUF45 domain-containing protein [Pseudomonadota bacterium]